MNAPLLSRLPALLRWLPLAFGLFLAACGQGDGAPGASGGSDPGGY